MDRISTLFYKKVNEIKDTSTLLICRDLTGIRLKRRCKAYTNTEKCAEQIIMDDEKSF